VFDDGFSPPRNIDVTESYSGPGRNVERIVGVNGKVVHVIATAAKFIEVAKTSVPPLQIVDKTTPRQA
jgi:hypothetical protein